MNKFIAFAVVFAVVATVSGNRERMEQIKASCQSQIGATDAEASELNNFGVPTSRNAKCMLQCIQSNLGMVLNASNQLDAQKSIDNLPSGGQGEWLNKMKNALTACNGTGGGDKCDAAALIASCLKSNM